MSTGVRNRRIDLLRGISILLVVFHHFNIAYHLPATALGRWFTPGFIRALARNGNYGVTIFFVISGFLITNNSIKRWGKLSNINILSFYGLRVARIIPCLLLLLLIVNILDISGFWIFGSHLPSTHEPVSRWIVNFASLTFWMNILIGHFGWVNYPLGVLWSLSVEEVFYITFPLVCIFIRSTRALIVFWLIIIIVGPFYRYFHQSDEGGFLFAYFSAFDGIAIGCCTAMLSQRYVISGVLSRIGQISTVAIMIFLYLWRPIGATNILGVSIMAVGAAFLLWTGKNYPQGYLLRRVILLRVVEWFGRQSYELYLFHLVILGLMRTFIPPVNVSGDLILILLVSYLAGSSLLAVIVAHFYSEPLNKRLRYLLVRTS